MADRYWIASSAGNWNDTANWSTSSGGAGGASVPNSSSDTAYFDSNGAGDCALDVSVDINDVDFTGYTGVLTLNDFRGLSIYGVMTPGTTATISGEADCFGIRCRSGSDVDLGSVVDSSMPLVVLFSGAVTGARIKGNATGATVSLNSYSPDRYCEFSGDFSCAEIAIAPSTAGAFVRTNGYTITVSGDCVTNSNATWLGMGGSILLNGSGAQNLSGSAEAIIINKSTGTVTQIGDVTTPDVTLTDGTLDIDGNTLSVHGPITCAAGTTVQDTAGTGTIEAGGVILNGTSGSGVTWSADISKLGPYEKVATYATITGSNNSSGVPIYAINDCTDGGSNSGWVFTPTGAALLKSERHRPVQRKPTRRTGINWNNALTRNLVNARMFFDVAEPDLVSGACTTEISPTSGDGIMPGAHGIRYSSLESQQSGGLLAENGTLPIASKSEYTLLVIGSKKFTSSSVWRGHVAGCGNGSYGQAVSVGFGLSTYSYSDHVEGYHRPNNQSFLLSDTSVSYANYEPAIIVLRVKTGELCVLDHASLADPGKRGQVVAGTATTDASVGWNEIAFAGNAYNGSVASGNTDIYLYLAWNRRITDAEVNALLADPYQIFDSGQDYLFIPAAGGSTDHPAAAALAATGALSAFAAAQRQGAAALAGSAAVIAAPSVFRNAAAAVSGAGALTAAATAQRHAAAAPAAAGALTAGARVNRLGAAALSGAGAVSATATGGSAIGALLSGSGTLSAAATVSARGAATLSGAGSASAQGHRLAAGAAALSGSAALAAVGAIGGKIGAASLSATATLSSTARYTAGARAQIGAVGAAAFSAHLSAVGAAALSAAGTFRVTYTPPVGLGQILDPALIPLIDPRALLRVGPSFGLIPTRSMH